MGGRGGEVEWRGENELVGGIKLFGGSSNGTKVALLTAPDTMVPMRVHTNAKREMGRDERWRAGKPRACRMLITTWMKPMMNPIKSMDAPAVSWADWSE